MARIGLVLGAGGVVGHAFHTGVLAALQEETGWDARGAELIVQVLCYGSNDKSLAQACSGASGFTLPLPKSLQLR